MSTLTFNNTSPSDLISDHTNPHDVATKNKQESISYGLVVTPESGIKMDSLDVDPQLINSLFNLAVAKCNNEIEEKLEILDIKQSRDLEIQLQRKNKKNAKLLRKEQAQTKTKDVYDITLPEQMNLKGKKILNVRFSQDSIMETTSDGIPLDELIENMVQNGWKKGTHLVAVSMPDGTLVSLNNRRLYAAKKASQTDKNFEVPVFIFDHIDPAPKTFFRGILNMFKKSHQDIEINKVSSDILEKSYGHCAFLRINTRQIHIKSDNFGFDELPTLRDR